MPCPPHLMATPSPAMVGSPLSMQTKANGGAWPSRTYRGPKPKSSKLLGSANGLPIHQRLQPCPRRHPSLHPQETPLDLLNSLDHPLWKLEDCQVVKDHGRQHRATKNDPAGPSEVLPPPSRKPRSNLVNEWLEVHRLQAGVMQRQPQICAGETPPPRWENSQSSQDLLLCAANREDLRFAQVCA